ncbi:MAG: glycosyltransferase family 4 protein [Lewinellaceae bacterium]|nr:glycosyltransferase family 4 protein [Lewinellaceae bacterium]
MCGLFPFRVVANSAHSAAVFRKRVLRKKLNIVYNGFDVDSFLAKRHRRTELRRLAYIGRFHTGKNVDLTIRLFNEIAGQQPQLELHLAGTGNLLGALEAQAAESPFRDRIKFHGWVQDMAAFYAGADLFIFPSAHESFGNVVLEALLTGLPVLASNIPAFDEIHGGDPAFSLGDPANYAEARERFLTGVAHFPELAEKAYALGGQLGPQFSMEKHLAGIGRMYD